MYFWRDLRTPSLVALLLLLATPLAEAATFDLRSPAWTITVDPATLAVTARLAAGSRISISSEQSGLGTPTNLTTSAKSATWNLATPDITASASLENNALTVHFTTNRAAKFTWPAYISSTVPSLTSFPKEKDF